jgi:hypothetical protein
VIWALAGDVLRPVPVALGLSDSAWTEIRRGLTPEDVVITELTHAGRLAYDIAH